MRARFEFGCSESGAVGFSGPHEVIEARSVAEVLPAFRRAEAALASGRFVAGWVAYGAAPAFDAALPARTGDDIPLVAFGVFDAPHSVPALEAQNDLPAPAWRPLIDQQAHAHGVAAIRDAIARGDTYQINYTFPLEARIDAGAASTLYQHLAWQAKAPYSACIEAAEWVVLSLSPELFFRIDGSTIITRPMKGTAPRGRWAAEDRALANGLHASPKNRAENVMIVDLCRNDLTRVCEGGSVDATGLFLVEPYPTVWQMVSNVSGRLRSDVSLTDVFGALFPAGSITGAPKTSSMRLIADLEPTPRGVYCGAIGYACPDGRAVFNVAIRTMAISRATGRATYGVGGGITWDSTAGDEHAEAMHKAACLQPQPAFELLETFRSEAGRAVRLPQHLERLRASAEHFGFVFRPDAIESALQRLPPEGLHRCRLVLDAAGGVTLTTEPFRRESKSVVVALAASPVDSRDVHLFHKTTRRQVYDVHRAAHPAVFDVLLWNERDELTEFTRGNVVVDLDGRRVTPARSSGLLDGVFRRVLLESGEIVEAVVTRQDLQRATSVWFINSLREWVPVTGWRTPGP